MIAVVDSFIFTSVSTIILLRVRIGFLFEMHFFLRYKLECKQYDFPEHKSFASSSRASQAGVYR